MSVSTELMMIFLKFAGRMPNEAVIGLKNIIKIHLEEMSVTYYHNRLQSQLLRYQWYSLWDT